MVSFDKQYEETIKQEKNMSSEQIKERYDAIVALYNDAKKKIQC